MEDETEQQKKKKEEEEEEQSLDSSILSIRSEIEGQKRCLEILNNNFNFLKDFKQGGGFKDIKILGKQYKPEFIQFVNNKKNNNNQATNDNVFGYKECFYHALLRTIENEKGIKFIGKNIQRFAGTDLFDIADRSNIGSIYHCLFLIATLTSQSGKFKEQQNTIIDVLKKMQLKQNDMANINKDIDKATIKNAISNRNSLKKQHQTWLQAICKNLDTIIKGFNQNERKIINKFLCQLFFLIFFTNKIDIKPENILVEQSNNNVKFIHTDVSGLVNSSAACEGMFDTFKNHEYFFWFFNKIFLRLLWKRISSKELDEYFNEYVGKYTLTEEKLKKIISRTVKNVFRSNDNIVTNKINEIQSQQLKDICRQSFTRMQEYMQYMLNKVIKEIELNDGDNEKKKTLINVLEQNCKVLNDMLADNKIDNCVDRSIKKYLTLKQEILINTDEKYNNNDKTQKELEHETRSTNKDDIINTTNNMRAKYNCWCIGDNDCVGCKKNGSGCGCFGCDIC